ncbi:MAG: bifunctional folylpolyglutamate synthase/dihydrofolate synthase [Sphaerochaetaceae bacterium]|nr:bifunctional folylpolyglutamate synthase/dihydrofolate synthase [Sphaerochaetaceae bacterium]
MHFKTFADVAQYLDNFSYKDKSLAPGALRGERLDRMRLILSRLNNPEKSFVSYHLAGSKGKGSTAAFLAAALTSRGEKCGLYLSPHLIDYRERFTLSGKFFPDECYLSAAEKTYLLMDGFLLPEGLGSVNPSTFEMYTAYAYMLFKEAGCTSAVIETGLGGRLDATNTLNSRVSIITPIELEHTQILGDTIEKIALEKAKIIKKDQLVFVSRQKEEARRVFEKEAEEQNSKIFFLSDEIEAFSYKEMKDCSLCSASFKDKSSFTLHLKMRGEVQAENALLAILVLKKLGLLEEKELKAIENTTLPGRFEEVDYKNQRFVFDVAHTKRSIENTINTFTSIYGEGNTLIFSALDGKDVSSMLKLLLPHFSKVIISRPGIFKISYPEKIYALAREISPNKDILLIEDANKAVESSINNMNCKGILVTGSFYLAGAIKEAMV